MEKLIGRDREQDILRKCLSSGKTEFVLVYGRRRIGKTFLIRSFFREQFAFSYTGGHGLSEKRQLESFALALQKQGNSPFTLTLKDWYDAFRQLQCLLEAMPSGKRKVVFIDEMSWMASPQSEFLKAFESFWNGWASHQNDLLFIACGSATSWMTEHILDNQGGLHNRITRCIYLPPFSLHDVEAYLQSRNMDWDRYQIMQAYMILGGVPYYYSLLDSSFGLVQNVDALFFDRGGQLKNEYGELYAALFNSPEPYLSVVETLASKPNGMGRQSIADKTGISGSTLTKILGNLEKCDFITSISFYGNAVKKTLYRLSDFYSLFHLKFVANNKSKDVAFWSHIINTPMLNSWQGYSFELLCILHLDALKRALGISGILTKASVWHNEDAKIDLLIERADIMINICEMKFSIDKYAITKDYEAKLRKKMEAFRTATKSRKGLLLTLVTTYGLKPGKNNSIVQSEITLDKLFSSTN